MMDHTNLKVKLEDEISISDEQFMSYCEQHIKRDEDYSDLKNESLVYLDGRKIDFQKLMSGDVEVWEIEDDANCHNLLQENKFKQCENKQSKEDPIVTKYRAFTCKICDFLATSNTHLRKHLLCHDETDKYINEETKFADINHRLDDLTFDKFNLKDNEKQMKYYCDMCGYSSKSKKFLLKHITLHQKKKVLYCNKCNYVCLSSYDLKRHNLNHDSMTFSHYCGKCCKNFDSSVSLNQHDCSFKYVLESYNIKHKKKTFSCDLCSFTCKHSGHLNRHKLQHFPSRTYSCKDCDYRCNQLSNLKRHRYIHMNDRPKLNFPKPMKCFSCHQCSYSSCYKSHLTRHLASHSRKKYFLCDICDHASYTRDDLRKHKLTKKCKKNHF